MSRPKPPRPQALAAAHGVPVLVEPGECQVCAVPFTTQSYDVTRRRPAPAGDATVRLCSLKCLRRWST